MNSNSSKKYKTFLNYSWGYLIVGLILLTYGSIKYFFLNHEIGIHLKTQQPKLIDGSIALIAGIIFFPIGLYRILNRTKVFKQEEEVNKIKKK